MTTTSKRAARRRTVRMRLTESRWAYESRYDSLCRSSLARYWPVLDGEDPPRRIELEVVDRNPRDPQAIEVRRTREERVREVLCRVCGSRDCRSSFRGSWVETIWTADGVEDADVGMARLVLGMGERQVFAKADRVWVTLYRLD